ncbi:MAG: sugar nucleotide-binding protein [Sandaracinus sp.]
MRILVTGGTGFVGANVARDLARSGHEVIATRHARAPVAIPGVAWEPLSLETPALPAHVEAVVHCAAIATVSACEADPARAERVNVEGTRRLALETAARGIPFVLASTDLVFDGSAPPYAERDVPTPASIYAHTKARAERAALEAHPHAHVLRLALVVGAHLDRAGGFLAWTLDALREGRALPLYTSQRRTPLFVGDVANVAEAACARRLAPGIYHLASEQTFTREEIGRLVARTFGLPEDAIVPTPFTRAGTLVTDDTTLRIDALRAAIGFSPTPLAEALSRVRRSLAPP